MIRLLQNVKKKKKKNQIIFLFLNILLVVVNIKSHNLNKKYVFIKFCQFIATQKTEKQKKKKKNI